MKEVANSRKFPAASGEFSARLEIRSNVLRPRRSFARRQLGGIELLNCRGNDLNDCHERVDAAQNKQAE